MAVLLTSLLAMACKEDFAPYVATIAVVLVLVLPVKVQGEAMAEAVL